MILIYSFIVLHCQLNNKDMKTKIFTTTKEGNKMIINVGLTTTNHTYFSITCDILSTKPLKYSNVDCERWKDGKYYNLLSCGCQHDEILKVRPDLKLLVDLHLSDEDGLPMYALENGSYWLHKDIKVFIEYMRTTEEEAIKLLKTTHNKIDFAMWVHSQRARYEKEAEEGKQLISKLIEENKQFN